MPKIRLLNVQFLDVNLHFESFEQGATDSVSEPDFKIGGLLSSETKNKFAIKYEIGLKSKAGFSLDLVSIAHFESDEELDNEFIDSDFAMMNAPAIGFPYVRAFISNLTLLSGFNPVFLPTINFIAMAQQSRQQSKEPSSSTEK